MIYLDHAATTPVRPEAVDAMLDCLRRCGNPSSLHSWGRAGREALDHARDTVADALGCRVGEIIFTSGGTESDNLAVIGGSRSCGDRKHVLVSAVEHHAVLHAAEALAAEGFTVETIPVDRWGRVDPQDAAARLRPDTALVSVMLANNETGTIQPVAEIAALCHPNGTLVHTDAVQAFPYLLVCPKTLGVDLLSLAAHKFGGPPGAGVLYVREGLEIRPTLFGGAQERGRRGGTENAPAIAGMDAAIQAFLPHRDEEAGRARELTTRLRSLLMEIPGAWFNTPEEGYLPSIVNVGFDGLRAETLLLALDLEGVAASSGSACASGSMEPSHVLRALGLPPDRAHACLRLSVGWTTTAHEIEAAAGIVRNVVARARQRE